MKTLCLVGLGGFLGAVARYKVGGLILHRVLDWRFPLSTLIVNVVGCCLAGLMAGLVEKHEWGSADLRIFFLPGVLGGFTTFSAFSVEAISLMQRHEVGIAGLYIAASLTGTLIGFWCGFKLIA